MRRAERIRLTMAGLALTGGWLALGTTAFIRWQQAEAPGAPTFQMLRPAFEAALLTAFVFWVSAGIVYGVVRWIVTGRGPRA